MLRRPPMRRGIPLLALLAVGAFPAVAQDVPAERITAEIRGFVRDGEDHAIAAATVRVLEHGRSAWFLSPDTGPRTEPFVTRSDETGAFITTGLYGKRFTVRIESAGFAPLSVHEIPPGASLSLHLEPGVPIRGRVLDAGSGQPLGGALAVACDDVAMRFGEESCQRAVADDEGRFVVAHAPVGVVQVRGEAVGHAWSTIRQVDVLASGDVDGEVELPLDPGGRLAGTVLDENDEPLSDATVRAVPTTPGAPASDRPWPVVSGEDGGFAIRAAAPGVYDVWANREGRRPGKVGPMRVEAGTSHDDLELRLLGPASVVFRLVGPDDRPIDRFELFLRESRIRTGTFAIVAEPIPEPMLRREDDGRTTIVDLDAGLFDFVFVPAGFAEVERTNVELRPGATVNLGTVEVDPGFAVRGRVADPAGAPIVDAEVSASYLMALTTRTRTTSTSEDGRYTLLGLDEDVVMRVTARATGYSRLDRTPVKPGDVDVDFVLQPNGGIAGRVELEGGGVPGAFHVIAHRAADEATDDADWIPGASRPQVDGSFSAEDGAFDLDDVAAGLYTLEIRAEGKATLLESNVSVVGEEITDVGTLVLSDGLVLDGRVVAADDDSPVAGASVELGVQGGVTLAVYDGTATRSVASNSRGAFLLDGLSPGLHRLLVQHAEFAPAELDVDLRRDLEPEELVVRLTRGGTLAGSVRDSRGEPVTAARVIVFEDALNAADGRSVPVGPEGRFELERLRPGRYQAVLILDTRDTSNPNTKTAVIRDGEVTVVDFNLEASISLTGSVRQGREPVRGASLLFMRDDSGPGLADFRVARTDEQGRYEVGMDRPGAYNVVVQRADPSEGGSGSVRIDVPDEPHVERNIVLLAGGISGTVTDVEGRPVVGASVSARESRPSESPTPGNARTDSAGLYAMEGLADGAYRVTASAPGYRVEVLESVNVAGRLGGLDFTLARGSAVRGRVVDSHGQGLAGALVVAAPAGMGGDSATTSTQTDVTGAFRFTAPSDGPLDVTAIAGGWAPVRRSGALPQSLPEDEEWVLQASRGGAIRIRVVTAEGRPLPAMQVQVLPAPPFLGSDLALMLTPPLPTDAAGETVVGALAPGLYDVSLPGREGVPPIRSAVSENGESSAELRLPGALE